MVITPAQIRAARALLRLDQAKVACDAGISVVTLRRLEADDGLSRVGLGPVDGVRRALERAGAEFIDRGVRRRERTGEELAQIKAEIDAIIARAAPRLARNMPLTDDELYDENGV
jgi:transcriptional regulator with XRE-family HTH domain